MLGKNRLTNQSQRIIDLTQRLNLTRNGWGQTEQIGTRIETGRLGMEPEANRIGSANLHKVSS
eukprot:3913547-Pyramimonas_sp.AAC.1